MSNRVVARRKKKWKKLIKKLSTEELLF